jgi:protein-S-isoprenylcysteine O-methyltransferase Ste14
MGENMNAKLVILFLLGEILSIAAAGLAMFWSAGRLDWWPAWAVLGVWVFWFAAEDIVLRSNPVLMAERLSPPKAAKTWDSALLSIARLLQLARYILAGLDQRFGWTHGFPLAAQIAALLVCLLGVALFAWAMASNTYFSQVVRIQSERGHVVAQGGPYRFVRHPAYVATILFELGLSTLLGSWWALLLGGVCALLFILRTALEDRTLQAELPGYPEYARRVRFRLVPGLW